ncbi:MAG: hypothetical protein JXB50_00620 [Spirochaetes bacterium]|nr:hypothetical protein [Spirochaetota bacterium]
MKTINKFIPLIITLLFFAVSFSSLFYHEMWRDEVQSWLIARDSSSIIELYNNLRYDGHPALWYICLKFLMIFFKSPVAMQVFHILISTTSVFLFVRFSPFNNLQKFLFSFGYFMLYEYTVIARLYAFSILFIIMFCVIYPKRYNNFLLTSLIIFFALQTNVFTVIIFIVTSASLLIDYIVNYKKIIKIKGYKLWKIIAGTALIIIGFIISILFIKSAPDESYLPDSFLKINFKLLAHVINIISRVYLPIPDFNTEFWYGSGGLGSFFLENFAVYRTLQTVVSLLILFWAIIFLSKKWMSLLIFTGSIAGLLIFYYIIFYGFFRHQGFVFIVLIYALWIYHYQDDVKIRWVLKLNNMFNFKLMMNIFTVILFIHFISAGISCAADMRYTFSYGKKAAKFIKDNRMQDYLIVGRDDFALTPVLGYANISRAYFPQGKRFGSFVKWDTQRETEVLNDEEMLIKAFELKTKLNKSLLIIVNKPLDEKLEEKFSLRLVGLFYENVIIKEEMYGLYIERGGIALK